MKKGPRSKKGFFGRLQAREQLLILAGCVLLVLLGLVVLPKAPTDISAPQRSEIELRDELGEAADAYMLAGSTAERQAAARRIHSIKKGPRSISVSSVQTFTALRWLLIITILVLAFKIFMLVLSELGLRKAPGS